MVHPAHLCAFEFVRPGLLCHKIEDLVLALLNLAVLLRIVENQPWRGFVLASFRIQIEPYAVSLVGGVHFQRTLLPFVT